MAKLVRLHVLIFTIFKGGIPFKWLYAGIWRQKQIFSFNAHNLLSICKKSIGPKRLVIVFLWVPLTINCFVATAQSFPVQVIPQVSPPSPIYFSQYANASNTNSPLRLQIILNDLEISNREIRLKAYFQGNGISFQSNDVIIDSSPLFLEGGIPLVLTNEELAPYFRFENITGISPNAYGQVIPEGAYQFCYEVYDVLTGNRLSKKSCAVSVIFQNEPPFLISPRNKIFIAENNPQNIIFQWTPRSINVSNVEYVLSLVEIWDNQIDPQAAFLSSPPVFQTSTTATTYVFGPSDPLLLSDKNYAWRIQAKAKQGAEEIGLFKNQGYSEIFSFSYAGSCDLPIGISHEVKGSTNTNIFWDDFTTDIPEYTIRYRQKSNQGEGNEWFLNKTTTNQTTLWDLKPGTTYEYQLQKKCVVTGSEWSTAQQFTTFLADNEASVYQCGITPNFSLTNKEPLPKLSSGESFVAGDFPINVLEVSGSNGRFTGKGYVTIPYLNSIKVGVEFTNVLINTDKQMSEGTVVTVYDPDLTGIMDMDEVVETVTDVYDAVADLGASVDDILKNVFGDDDENEENAPSMKVESIDIESSNTPNDDKVDLETNGNDLYAQGEITSGNSSNTSNINSGPNNNDNVGINLNSNPSPESDTGTNEKVVIEFNGTEYNNNDVITVPYDKNNSHYAFILKNYPENEPLNWQVLYLGSDYTSKHVTNAPKHDNLGVDMKKVYNLDIVANYNNQKIKVTIKRELEDFSLMDIYAKPEDSPKRIAKTGQKLYLQNSPTPSASTKREVDFSIRIEDNLSQGDISAQDIVWYYEEPNQQNNLGKNFGKKNIHLNLTEQESTFLVNVKAGRPNFLEKGIDVVWFERNYSKNKFSLGTDANPFLKKALELTEEAESLSKLLEKIPFIEKINKEDIGTGVGFYFNVIPFQQVKENFEHEQSRFYYTEKTTTGGIEAGLKGQVKWTVWGLPYDKLPLPDWVIQEAKEYLIMEVYVIAKAQAGGELKVELKERKLVEQNEWKEYYKGIDPALIKLNLELGAGAEISLLKSNDYFSISGEAKGVAKTELMSIGWQKGQDFDIYFLRQGVWMDISATAYVKIFGKKLETTPFYKKIQIIEKPE